MKGSLHYYSYSVLPITTSLYVCLLLSSFGVPSGLVLRFCKLIISTETRRQAKRGQNRPPDFGNHFADTTIKHLLYTCSQRVISSYNIREGGIQRGICRTFGLGKRRHKLASSCQHLQCFFPVYPLLSCLIWICLAH